LIILHGSYNSALAILSVFIAIFAAYTALNLISCLKDMHSVHLTRTRVGAGGLVMGLGIWGMHFVAMLAYNLPVQVRYDGALTLWSLVVAVAACITGLAIASYQQARAWIVTGGILLGIGISSMHYIGMAAMQMPAHMKYDLLLLVTSVLIGVGAAVAALWVAFAIGRGDISGSFKIKSISAVFMGFAIAGMHYTGMAAMTVYVTDNPVLDPGGFDLNPALIGVSLTVAVILIMSFALWSSRLVAETNLIRASEEKVSAITENVVDVIIMINSSGMIEFTNIAVEKVFGYKPSEIVGKNVNILMPDPWHQRHDQYISHYLESAQPRVIGMTQRELQGLRKDGTVFPVEVAVNEAAIADSKVFIGTIRDISERLDVQQRLYYLAHHDVLTALPNRLSFQEHIEQALAHAKRRNCLVAVMFMDLDRFKVINDTLGHHAGDYLLKGIAQRLKRCVREGDVVARLSGDEFTVLLDDVTALDDIAPIANKIIAIFTEPFFYLTQELFTTASIGISLFPDDSADPQSMMQHADIAMYRAKAEGGNRFCFYTSDMNDKANDSLKLETGLRHALERDEFQLYYQPQVDVENGVIIGVEALLRWQHPKLGLIAPLDFISLLEETGLIVPVGEWVIRTACLQNLAWQQAGIPPIHVAVNLSARQFNEQSLAKQVATILDETGLAPEYLELEITENILMQQTNVTNKIVRDLHVLGVQLAIDDFGTGYSSLSYLRKFPIHTLKIDRAFVRDITTDADDAAIVQLIIDMAHSLKLNVIAEGVETMQQLAFLQERKCWEMQGYYFSHPKPGDELLPFLINGVGQLKNNRSNIDNSKQITKSGSSKQL